MIKVSVIVPIYQVEDYLSRCLDSIMNQTFTDFECILVNDGSKDRSKEIAERYVSIDHRFVLINKKNGGLSSARNAGIEKANGQYLCFVDSDDCLHSRYLEHLYFMISKSDSDMSICGFKSFEFDKETDVYADAKLSYEVKDQDIIYSLVGERRLDFIVAWNKMYRRDLFDSIRYPEGKLHEDEFIAHELLRRAKRVAFTSLPLYFYFQRSDSIMGKKFSIRNLDALEAFEQRVQKSVEWHFPKLETATRAMICGWIYDRFILISKLDRQIEDRIYEQFQRHYNQLKTSNYHFGENTRRFALFAKNRKTLKLLLAYGKIKRLLKR